MDWHPKWTPATLAGAVPQHQIYRATCARPEKKQTRNLMFNDGESSGSHGLVPESSGSLTGHTHHAYSHRMHTGPKVAGVHGRAKSQESLSAFPPGNTLRLSAQTNMQRSARSRFYRFMALRPVSDDPRQVGQPPPTWGPQPYVELLLWLQDRCPGNRPRSASTKAAPHGCQSQRMNRVINMLNN